MTIGAVDAVVLEEASDSTVQFIRLLAETGSWLGAVLVTIFAICVPLLKILLLVLGEMWRDSPVPRPVKATPLPRQDPARVRSARIYIRFVR